jgi:hypothetical protein
MLLSEQLSDIGRQLACVARELDRCIEHARSEQAVSPTTVTRLAMTADSLRRYDQVLRGVRANAELSAEGMNFCVAAFHRIGRNAWRLLRTVLPLPHESYLREARRGTANEGIKFTVLRDSMLAAIRRSRTHRARHDPASPDKNIPVASVWDVVVSFDAMYLREQFAYARGTDELRGFTTECSAGLALDIFGTHTDEEATKARTAKQWLTFFAIPLVGGFTCRFQVASYAVGNPTSSEILKYIHDCISALTCFGFRVRCIVCDGAAPHRRLQRRLLTHSEEDILAGVALPSPSGRFKVAFEDPVFK